MQCIGGAALFVVCALKTDVVTVADQGGGGGGGGGVWGPFFLALHKNWKRCS